MTSSSIVIVYAGNETGFINTAEVEIGVVTHGTVVFWNQRGVESRTNIYQPFSLCQYWANYSMCCLSFSCLYEVRGYIVPSLQMDNLRF